MNEIMEIKIDSRPALVSFNYNALKESLENHLEKYRDAVVTLESLADDKKLVAEIRSKAKDISKARIATVKELTAPVSEFEQQMKHLASMCNDVAQSINDQVSVFEQQKLEEILDKVNEYAQKCREDQGVPQEFWAHSFNHLAKLTAITKTGRLTGKVTSSVKEAVADEYAFKLEIDNRLAKLEATCYKSGLSVPLTKDHVISFLYDDEEIYNERLEAMIQSEIKRQQEVERLQQERQAKQEQATKVEPLESAERAVKVDPLDQVEQERREHIEKVMAEAQTKLESEQAAGSENKVVIATATFTVTVPNRVTNEQVERKLRSILEGAGVTTLTGIKVEKWT